jgi:cytochrome c2
MKRVIVGGWTGLALLSVAVFGVRFVEGAEVENGRKFYEEKRCGLCHAIAGRGGKIGPDLTDVGSQRDGDWINKFLKDPKGTVPNAKMLPVKATDQELAMLVDYLLSLKR